jgi:transcriptional regulator with XRE-family HTH domain
MVGCVKRRVPEMLNMENLRWMIKKSGKNYQQLEELTGIHRNTIRRIVQDEGYNPTLATIRAILDAFRE